MALRPDSPFLQLVIASIAGASLGALALGIWIGSRLAQQVSASSFLSLCTYTLFLLMLTLILSSVQPPQAPLEAPPPCSTPAAPAQRPPAARQLSSEQLAALMAAHGLSSEVCRITLSKDIISEDLCDAVAADSHGLSALDKLCWLGYPPQQLQQLVTFINNTIAAS